MRRVTVVIVAVIALAVSAPAAWGQVAGTVTESGATTGIGEATVELRSDPGGELVQSGTANSEGAYAIPVGPGDYLVQATACGYAPSDPVPVTAPAEGVNVALVAQSPVAGIDGPARVVRGRDATFTSTSTGADLADEWTVDGVPLGATETVSRQFAESGSVELTVTDCQERTDSATHDVVVNTPPTADLTFSPATPRAGDTVMLTAAGADADNDPLTYAWDLDGDGFDDGTGATVRQAYPTSGRFEVAVRIHDGFESTVVSGTVAVAGPPILPSSTTGDTVAPALTVKRRGSRALRAIRRRGLRFALTCDEPCTVYLEVLVSRRTARKLRIARHPDGPVRIGRVTKSSGPDGSRARLSLTEEARKRLKGVRRVKLTLQGSAWDAGGYATLYLPRKLTLRRGR